MEYYLDLEQVKAYHTKFFLFIIKEKSKNLLYETLEINETV